MRFYVEGSRLFNRSTNEDSIKVKSYVDVIEKVVNEKTGLIEEKVVCKELTDDRYEGLSSYDFDLDHIVLAGATSLLQPCPKVSGNVFDISDSLASNVDYLGDYYETNKNIKEDE
ncbi:hypothetical protein [Capybara microvirus Cap1_SP_109]|nr:hypothetical protein [Capybara microvirus Cap1_SP_109]